MDARGFTAKVSDFGLSKLVADTAMTYPGESSNEASGTITHMAPETLSEGKASPAADVYAFGILSARRLACCENDEHMEACMLQYRDWKPIRPLFPVKSAARLAQEPSNAACSQWLRWTVSTPRCLTCSVGGLHGRCSIRQHEQDAGHVWRCL